MFLHPETELRARHEQWCFFALTELEQPLWNMVKHRYALPKEHRVREILETANWEYQKTLNLLADGLGKNTFILGEQFHGVDILLGHCLRWGLAFKQPLEQENLRDYLERLSLRPALERAQTRESEGRYHTVAVLPPSAVIVETRDIAGRIGEQKGGNRPVFIRTAIPSHRNHRVLLRNVCLLGDTAFSLRSRDLCSACARCSSGPEPGC